MTEANSPAMTATLAPAGGCNCGAIRYRVTRPFLTAYICHCHLCQKRTGSAFSFSVVLPAGGLELVAGQPLRTERLLADGSRNISWICPACYSRIYTQREDSPAVNLRAGTLDEPASLGRSRSFGLQARSRGR
jgi:hypothetical protein